MEKIKRVFQVSARQAIAVVEAQPSWAENVIYEVRPAALDTQGEWVAGRPVLEWFHDRADSEEYAAGEAYATMQHGEAQVASQEV